MFHVPWEGENGLLYMEKVIFQVQSGREHYKSICGIKRDVD